MANPSLAGSAAIEALHILRIFILPLKDTRLKPARLVKNAQMRGVVGTISQFLAR